MSPGDFHLRLAHDAVAAAGERVALLAPPAPAGAFASAAAAERTGHLCAARAWLRAAAKNLALAEAEFLRPPRRAGHGPCGGGARAPGRLPATLPAVQPGASRAAPGPRSTP